MKEPRTEDLLWGALANPVRRGLLDLLRDRPRTTGELAAAFPRLSRFAIMQHLDALEEAGVVLVRREGRQRYNYLNALPIQQLYERWVSRFAAPAAANALALQRYIESETRSMPKADPAGQSAGPQTAGRIIKVELEQRFDAPIEKVFAALTTEMDNWWAFRFKNESKVVVEPWVGGRIFEDWGDGGGALYGHVVYYEPPYRVCSRGPGGIDANFSNLNWEVLRRDGEGTIRNVSLRIWGEVPDDMEKIFTEGAKAISQRLLKEYVEQGKTWRDSPRNT